MRISISPARKPGMKVSQTLNFPAVASGVRTVPAVEVADYADTIRIGRPNRERDTTFPFMSEAVGAELFIDAFVPAFGEQMKIDVAESGRELWRSSTHRAFARS
jgi:hypothetical protein